MNIELRNIKHAAFASQETNCFEATIYVDGVKAGDARNDGHGGCTFIEPRSLNDRIEAYAKTLPPIDISDWGLDGKTTMPKTAELVIDQLLTDWLVARDMKKAMSKRIIFKRDGKMLEFGPFKPDRMAAFLAHPPSVASLRADHVLNLMPFADALALYRKD